MSDRTQEPESVAAPRAMTYLADVGAGLRRSTTGAWMITFTDLIALLLAFFVLLFAMSTVERYKWQNLVRSLASNMDSIQTREGAKPAVEFQIDQETPAPGGDLDYLTPLIEQQLASEPAISNGIVWRQSGRTLLSFPAAALFDKGERTIAGRAGPAIYAISRMIQTLNNLVEVHAHTARIANANSDLEGWERSLARASAAAAALTEVGYRGTILSRGYGSAHAGGFPPAKRLGPAADAEGFAERIDIVIYEDAPKGPR